MVTSPAISQSAWTAIKNKTANGIDKTVINSKQVSSTYCAPYIAYYATCGRGPILSYFASHQSHLMLITSADHSIMAHLPGSRRRDIHSVFLVHVITENMVLVVGICEVRVCTICV